MKLFLLETMGVVTALRVADRSGWSRQRANIGRAIRGFSISMYGEGFMSQVSKSVLLPLVGLLLTSLPAASAADRTWVGGDGFWDVGENWSDSTKPVAGDFAYLDNGSTVTVRTAEEAEQLNIGYFDVAGGSLVITSTGSLDSGFFLLAVSSDSTGSLEIESGGLMTVGFGQIGSYGDATAAIAGDFSSEFGFVVGLKGTGLVTQTSGVVSSGGSVSLGDIGAQGGYELLGGTLAVSRGDWNAINLGLGGVGSLKLGDAVGTGEVTETGTGSGVDLNIGSFVDYGGGWIVQGAGEVRGHGVVGLTGTLDLQIGKVIADGFGVDRDLDLGSMASVVNGFDNPAGSDSGWYAQSGGRLILPSLEVAQGNHAYNWGETIDDATLDLINSVQLAFDQIGDAGSLTGSLLAHDHSQVAPGLSGTAIGVWDFVLTGADFDAVTLTLRYDDSLVDDPALLRVFHHTDGSWSDITATLSLDDLTITTSAVGSLSQFAVVVIPEPSAALVTLFGLGMLCLRKPRG